jgi:hypothetical protein
VPIHQKLRKVCVVMVEGQRRGGEDHRQHDQRDANDVHDQVDLDEFAAEVTRGFERG